MIFIGADHRGFYLKEKIKAELQQRGYDVNDLGAYEYNESDDYPDIATKVAEKVSHHPNSKGIILCGTGIGVCISANKVKNIRAGLAINEEIVKRAKEEDDINILCLPADYLDKERAISLVELFLKTEFKGEEKYLRRIKKIEEYELIGQLIVVVSNLEEKEIRGIKSEGMLLAADSPRGPILIVPLEQVEPGTSVK